MYLFRSVDNFVAVNEFKRVCFLFLILLLHAYFFVSRRCLLGFVVILAVIYLDLWIMMYLL